MHPVPFPRIEPGNDLIAPPPWRTRTSPRRLAIATTVTVGFVTAVGAVLLLLVIRLLDLTGVPAPIVWAPWYVPTMAAIVWTLRRPRPATVEDGDESWIVHALRAALVGVDTPRPIRRRVAVALLLGAPIAWALVVVGLLALAGIA